MRLSVIGKVQENKPHWASSFQTSALFTFADIPMAKAGHRTVPRSRGGKNTPPTMRGPCRVMWQRCGCVILLLEGSAELVISPVGHAILGQVIEPFSRNCVLHSVVWPREESSDISQGSCEHLNKVCGQTLCHLQVLSQQWNRSSISLSLLFCKR